MFLKYLTPEVVFLARSFLLFRKTFSCFWLLCFYVYCLKNNVYIYVLKKFFKISKPLYMNNIDKYYNSFGLDKTVPRSFIKKQELNNIFAVPEKEQNKDMPHFYNFVFGPKRSWALANIPGPRQMRLPSPQASRGHRYRYPRPSPGRPEVPDCNFPAEIAVFWVDSGPDAEGNIYLIFSCCP